MKQWFQPVWSKFKGHRFPIIIRCRYFILKLFLILFSNLFSDKKKVERKSIFTNNAGWHLKFKLFSEPDRTLFYGMMLTSPTDLSFELRKEKKTQHEGNRERFNVKLKWMFSIFLVYDKSICLQSALKLHYAKC